MEQTKTQTTHRSKWTKHFALLLSLLYLANPLYRPLQVVLHETISLLEAPDSAIGYNSIHSMDNEKGIAIHEHNTLELEYGHEIIDLLGLALNTSEEQKTSDESIPESPKVDKHVVVQGYGLGRFQILKASKQYFFPVAKSKLGFPEKSKEPPRFS